MFDATHFITQRIQLSLDASHDSHLISIDFSPAFDRVKYKALLYRIRCLCIGRKFFNTLIVFLANRTRGISVNGSFSYFSQVKSSVLQSIMHGLIPFIIYNADM